MRPAVEAGFAFAGVSHVATFTHNEADKEKALAIAELTSVREAAEQTGIPEGTIKRWRYELRTAAGATPKSRVPPPIREALDEARAQAVAAAGELLGQKLMELIDGLYGLAREALAEARATITAEDSLRDRDTAAWLRACIGAMHYGIQDSRLIAGESTSKSEVSIHDADGADSPRDRLARRIDELAQRRGQKAGAGGSD